MVSAAVISAAKRAPCQARPATLRTNEFHATVSERETSATIAQRRSPEAQFRKIECSNAQLWARKTGPRLLRIPKSHRIIMDKFPSVEVLSRYSRHLLPTC